jgi:metal-dependent amidase/aminoacylase/carboxypeptidase family protein
LCLEGAIEAGWVLLAFTTINSLRQHIRSRARVHGIITNGGEAANTVPAHTSAIFILRSEGDSYLEELKQKVINCFIGCATATGARLEYKWGSGKYAAMVNNSILARRFRNNMEFLGREVKLSDPDSTFGGTDMGNVSLLVPSIHPRVSVASEGALHSVQFAIAAASESGTCALLDAAKALAMTVVDLASNQNILSDAKEEFKLIGKN